MKLTIKTNIKEFKILIGIITFFLSFKGSLGILIPGFELAIYPITGSFILYYLIRLFFKRKVKKEVVYLVLFFLYLIFQLLIFTFISIVGNFSIAIIGFLNISLFLFFWFILYLNHENFKELFEFYLKLLLVIAIINSIGIFIQFFWSYNIFGLIEHSIYTREVLPPNVEKRAVSFITSPQVLAIFLAVCFVISLNYNFKNNKYKILISFIIFAGGFLTFSKAFILFVIVYFLITLFSLKRKFILISFCIIIFLYFVSCTFDSYNVQRIFSIPRLLINLSNYGTFQIWKNFVTYESNMFEVLFGHGIGVLSRGGQMFSGKQILNGSAESYIIQVYFEIGFIGLILFLYMYISSIRNLLRVRKYRYLSVILIAFVTNMIATPAFYSFTLSFFMYPIIIIGFFFKQK